MKNMPMGNTQVTTISHSQEKDQRCETGKRGWKQEGVGQDTKCHKQLAFHFGLFTAYDKQPLKFYWPIEKLTSF